MDESKRRFLKVAGVSVLGIGWSVPVVSAIGQAFKTETWPKALAGKRWAMVVDTKKCEAKHNCTACTDACHRMHNVPQIKNPRHEIKWIWKEEYKHVFHEQINKYTNKKLMHRHVPILCNHCDNPSCVRVCPTKATFKRVDGVIMMDQHRCIGCRYCIVACPYGARSFNFFDPRKNLKNVRQEYPTRMKGVVEKCNLCAERLAEGKLPICVETCRKSGAGALMFGDLGNKSSEIYKFMQKNFTLQRKPGLGNRPHVFYVV